MRGAWALLVASGIVMGQAVAAQDLQNQGASETPQLQTRGNGQAQSQAASQATATPVTPQPVQSRDALGTPVPQTPREVLVEILRAKDGTALERHLPEITKKKMKEMGGMPGFLGVGSELTAIGGWSARARRWTLKRPVRC